MLIVFKLHEQYLYKPLLKISSDKQRHAFISFEYGHGISFVVCPIVDEQINGRIGMYRREISGRLLL